MHEVLDKDTMKRYRKVGQSLFLDFLLRECFLMNGI